MTLEQYELNVEKTGARRGYKAPQTLVRCQFDLAPQHTTIKADLSPGAWRWKGGISPSAELYLQTDTARLFVALSLDDAISLARVTASRGSTSSAGGRRTARKASFGGLSSPSGGDMFV